MTARWRARVGLDKGTFAADLTAGVTATLVSVPTAIGYGLFAFAPLGPDYFGYGVLAGLYCAVFMSVTALALGARSRLLYGPRNVVTFMINALVLHTLIETHGEVLATLPPHLVVSLVLLFGLLAGALQVLFGALRLGNAVKFVPHPVIAGFQSTAALLLILGQVDAVLGFVEHVPLAALPARLNEINPIALGVAALTFSACLIRPRMLTRVPSLVVGGLIGTATFHALTLLLPGQSIGAVIGTVPGGLPWPLHAPDFWWLLSAEPMRPLLPSFALGALSIALVASLDALLSAKVIGGADSGTLDVNREMVRIGAGNMVGACFGAIPGAIALASSLASQRAGARTALAGVVQLLLILLIVTLLGSVLGTIPRAVVGSLLIVVGLGLFDRWTLRIVGQALRGNLRPLRAASRELSIVSMFAAIALTVHIVAAVAIGVVVSIVYFIVRMSRSVIRRSYRCALVRSRCQRPPADEEALATLGRNIVVFELEGSIFFGTAENLANRIERACQDGVTIVVLDLTRVTEVDITGARILTRVNDLLVGDGHHLLLSGLARGGPLDRYLDAARTRTAITAERVFPDTDRALEWAEDRMLLAAAALRTVAAPGAASLEGIDLRAFDLFAGLAAPELDTLRAALALAKFERAAVLFREGETGDALYLVVDGTASVWLGERATRLITFSPGTILGELALIDDAPRSATVVADTALTCLVLTIAAYERLAVEAPATSISLTANLGRELAHRLRRANRTVLELDR
ncbi:MAG: SLC26A/SulP transporter family protein [Proteobacteria bacterium]|nr:SLC26A/SulP transporter family protein [Burkholderiales bacterium]